MSRASFPRPWRRAGLGLALGLAAGCHTMEPGPPPVAAPTPRVPRTADARQAAAAEPSAVEPAAAAGPAPPAGPKASGIVVPPAPPAQAAPPAEADAPIDLAAALRLAGVDNPTINLAREAVTEALARQTAARALLLPNLTAGGNLRVHRGSLLTASGVVRDVDSQSLYLGAGASAVGTGTVGVPGVRLFSHLGDAVFEPLAARQRVAVRASESQAVRNQVLLDVAVRYLDLVEAEARLEALRQSDAELAEVVRVTAAYARAGQGRASDANRAAANADLFRRQTEQAQEQAAVASARLAELLSLDPSARLHPPPGWVRPVRLVAEDGELAPLIAQAVRDRPEVAARSAAVAEARTRVRQERVRPWLPTVSLGFSAGGFGGGSDLAPPALGPLRGRTDFDAVAFWTFQNLGVGNVARTRRESAVEGQALAELGREVNQIREEVAAAKADAEAAARRIDLARGELTRAGEGFTLEMSRTRQGEGRPLEVLDSLRQLADARQALLRAIVEFNRAQFRLFVALGCSPLAPPAAADPAAANPAHGPPPNSP